MFIISQQMEQNYKLFSNFVTIDTIYQLVSLKLWS